FLEARRTVGRAEHAVVVLRPEHFGFRHALCEAMHILDVGVVAALGWHEFGVHALAGELPALAAVGALPGAAARDGDGDLAASAADRMDARLVVAAAEPLRTFLALPKRAHQRPALAPVGRVE